MRAGRGIPGTGRRRLPSVTDGEVRRLIERAGEGDGDAAGELARRYEARVKAAISKRLGPALRARVDTEDIFQSTFMAAIGDLEGFDYRGDEAFVGWLATIAEWRVRKWAKHHRAGKRDVRRERPLDDAGVIPATRTSPPIAAQRSEMTERVRSAVKRLPEPDRQVVEMRSFEGLQFRQIAERLGLADKDAARYVLQRGLKTLSQMLDD